MSGPGWRRELGSIVGALDYPMLVVTTAAAGRRAGCLVGFATQASIDPPRLLVGISRANRTYRVARAARALAAHFPTADQVALAELFGAETGDEVDKLARCEWHEGPEGMPILDACPSWIVGRVADRVDMGDHVGFLLDVVAARDGAPGRRLSFQRVRHLEAGHDP